MVSVTPYDSIENSKHINRRQTAICYVPGRWVILRLYGALPCTRRPRTIYKRELLLFRMSTHRHFRVPIYYAEYHAELVTNRILRPNLPDLTVLLEIIQLRAGAQVYQSLRSHSSPCAWNQNS